MSGINIWFGHNHHAIHPFYQLMDSFYYIKLLHVLQLTFHFWS